MNPEGDKQQQGDPSRNQHHEKEPSAAKQFRHSESKLPDAWPPDECRHRKIERYYWAATLFLTVIVATGAGLSAIYAYSAADAAVRQADAADKTLRFAQRAYIVVSELKIEAVAGQPDLVEITPVIRNSGTTPASSTVIAHVTPHRYGFIKQPIQFSAQTAPQLDYIVGAPPDPFDVLVGKDNLSKNFRTQPVAIGPQSTLTYTMLSEEFFKTDSLAASSNKIGRFVYGAIGYKDIFDRAHITKYCFRIDGFLQGGSQPFRNMYSLCRHWNCLDDECLRDKISYSQEIDFAVHKNITTPLD